MIVKRLKGFITKKRRNLVNFHHEAKLKTVAVEDAKKDTLVSL